LQRKKNETRSEEGETEMTEREKLIELIADSKQMNGWNVENKWGRIEDLADHLLSNGVIVPPCKVGDRVWHLRGWCDGSFEIAEGKVSMLQQKADKSWKVRISVNSSVWDFTPNEIGTRYFLTKEEAEKALKERSEGK
jgi:hypothetical protein